MEGEGAWGSSTMAIEWGWGREGVVWPALQEFISWSGFGILERERSKICILEEWNFVGEGLQGGSLVWKEFDEWKLVVDWEFAVGW